MHFNDLRRRTLYPMLPMALLILWCCGSGDITFSPERDAQALGRILQSWSGTIAETTFSLTVCEDTAENASFVVDGCTYAHLVQSENPASESAVSRASGGCENCFLGVLTNVIATLSKADGTLIHSKGIVSLGTTFDEDPYEGDYGLLLYADGNFVMEGRIQSDGTLILSGAALLNLGFEVTETEVKIQKGEASSCMEE